MAAYSYPVTFATGKRGAIDSETPLDSEQLQAHLDAYNQQDIDDAQAAAARNKADTEAGRLTSYGGNAARSFVAPLGSLTRGTGEMFDSPTLVRGGNELEQRTATTFPTNPEYANDVVGKTVGTTAGLAGAALPFLVPYAGEVLGPASLIPQTYDAGYREARASGVPLSEAEDYARTHVAAQLPLMVGLGMASRAAIAGRGASAAAGGLIPRMSPLAELGLATGEAGAIGAASRLADNLQAGPSGYNIDPNRTAFDDVLSSGAYMAGGAGLLGLPRLLLHSSEPPPSATPDTTPPPADDSTAVPAAPARTSTQTLADALAQIRDFGAKLKTPAPAEASPTTVAAAARTLPVETPGPLELPPVLQGLIPPLSGRSAEESAATIADPNNLLNLNARLAAEEQAGAEQRARIESSAAKQPVAADKRVNVLDRIRASVQTEAERQRAAADAATVKAEAAERDAAVTTAATEAVKAADTAEPVAPATAAALREKASEVVAAAAEPPPVERPVTAPSIPTPEPLPVPPPQAPAPLLPTPEPPPPVVEAASPPATADATKIPQPDSEVPPAPASPSPEPVPTSPTVEAVRPPENSESPNPTPAPVSSEAVGTTEGEGTGTPEVEGSAQGVEHASGEATDLPADGQPRALSRAQFTEEFEREGRTGNPDKVFDEEVQAGVITPLDDQGRPITRVSSDPNEAMKQSGDVQADNETVDDLTGGVKSDETVRETAPKPESYGSRINDDYFHLPQETPEYMQELSALKAVKGEQDMLAQAHEVLQKRKYEVENKVGGYESRGGTDATERVMSAALLKYWRNLRDGASGKNGFKPNEVGQVLNNVIRDFQKGASKRRVNSALDAPVGEEGSASMGDLVADQNAANPADVVALSDDAQKLDRIKATFNERLSVGDRARLEEIFQRVAAGEHPHDMSTPDILLWDSFDEYANEQFSDPKAGQPGNSQQPAGDLPAAVQADVAPGNESPGGRGERAGQQGYGEPERGATPEAVAGSEAQPAALPDTPGVETGEGAHGPEFAVGDRVSHARRAAQVRSLDGDTATIRYKGSTKDVQVPASELSAPSRSRFRLASNPAGDMDVIDHIIDEGGIMSRTQASSRGKNMRGAGEYDDAPDLKGVYNSSVYGGNLMPDQMAKILYENGVIPEADVPMMWQAISDAIRSRADHREQEAQYKVAEGQFDRFNRDTKQGRSKKEVSTEKLNVGDIVTIGKEKLKVTGVDPDSGDVTLQDGRKYGRQQVPGHSTIWVERFRRGPKESGVYDDPFADEPASAPSAPPPSTEDPSPATTQPFAPEALSVSSRPAVEESNIPPASDQDPTDRSLGGTGRETPVADESKSRAEEGASGESKLPTLRHNENQGDLLSNQSEDLTLVGEKGTDFAARQAEQERQAREAEETRAQQQRDQMGLFGGDEQSAESRLLPEHTAALDTSLDQAKPTLDRLGVPIRERSDNKAARGMAAAYDAEGNVWLEVNRNGLADNLSGFDTPAEGTEFVQHGVAEEVTHLADIMGERAEWEKQGKPGDFDDFVTHRKVELLSDIHDDLATASPKARATLEGALLDGWNLYRDPQRENVLTADEAHARVAQGDSAFSFNNVDDLMGFLAANPERVTNYMMETLRQLVQIRSTDPRITTETAYVSVLQKFRAFVDQLLQRLRRVAADPKAFSPALADAIRRVESARRGEVVDRVPQSRGRTGDDGAQRVELPPAKPARRMTGDDYDPERGFVEKVGGTKLPPAPSVKSALPSARERVGEAVESAKTFGGRLVQSAKKFGALNRLTDRDVVLRDLSANEQINSLHADAVTTAFQKAVPNLATREAITVFVDAGGDTAALTRARDAAKNAEQRARYERALSLTPDEKKVAGAVSDFYKSKLDDGQRAGILGEGRDNYINRIVKQPFFDLFPEREPGGAGTGGRLSKRFRFAEERKFPTLADVEKAGYTPQTYDAAELMGIYSHELGRAKLTRDFVERLKEAKGLDGRPLLGVRGEVPKIGPGPKTDAEKEAIRMADRSDYVQTDGARMLGSLSFHPDAARSGSQNVSNVFKSDAISKWLRESSDNPFAQLGKTAVRGLDSLQGVIKETMFDLSPFHMTTEAVHATGHRINPLGSIEKFDPENLTHMELVKGGLMLVPSINGVNHFAEGLTGGSRSLVRKVPVIGDFAKKSSDFLFHNYIPSLKLKTARALLERNLKTYTKEIADGSVTRQDVVALSADQANNAYGHLNYTAMSRNPTMQHVFRLAALAPDFLEARLKFSGQAAQGLAGKVGRQQIEAMGLLFLSQFVLTRIYNKTLDDNWHWDQPFSFVHGNRALTLRSVPEDIFKAVTETSKFISGRESPYVRTGVQILTGRNYRGERTTTGDALRELGAGALPISLKELPGLDHLSATQRNATVKWWEAGLGALGFHIGRVSAEHDVYGLANDFKKSKGIKEDTGVYPTSPLTPIKYALQDNDLDRARTELKSLAASGKTRAQIMQSLHASIMHPYTGSQAMDREFSASLSPTDRTQLQAAQKARAQMLERARALVTELPPTVLVKK